MAWSIWHCYIYTHTQWPHDRTKTWMQRRRVQDMLTHWKFGIRNATCRSHTLAIGRFHFLASLIDRFEVLIDRKSIKKYADWPPTTLHEDANLWRCCTRSREDRQAEGDAASRLDRPPARLQETALRRRRCNRRRPWAARSRLPTPPVARDRRGQKP